MCASWDDAFTVGADDMKLYFEIWGLNLTPTLCPQLHEENQYCSDISPFEGDITVRYIRNGNRIPLALGDRFGLFIQTLNNA